MLLTTPSQSGITMDQLPRKRCSASSSRPSGPCSTRRPTSSPCRCTTASWACCPGRAPLIGRLGYGELRTAQGQQTQRFFIDGGFAQVRDNVVTVLTPRAIKAEEIDTAAASAQIEAAQQPAATPEARAVQQEAAAKARVQLRVAGKETPHF